MKLWKQPGRKNTEDTAREAVSRMRDLEIEDVVIASNTGYTVETFLKQKAEVWPEGKINIVAITHHVGFRNPGEDEMPAEMREWLEARGVNILTTTHLFGNVERAITQKFGGLYPGGIISATLRMFGEGTKVCLEIATTALDAGLVAYGKEIVAVAGSGGGADTALTLRPAHAKDFFDGEILDVVCRPRGRKRR